MSNSIHTAAHTVAKDSESSIPTDNEETWGSEIIDITLPDGKKDSLSYQSDQDSAVKDEEHSNWIWLHAAYHFLVTIVGTGILGFPKATSYLGFAGATILITSVTAAAYYTANLLTDLQKPHHGTYSEIANDVMGRPNFATFWIKPFQFFNFFPTAAVMIFIGGEAMSTMDVMSNGNEPRLHPRTWTVVMGALVFLLSMAPDLHHLWQVSAVGCVSVVMMTIYCIVGSSEALHDPSFVQDYGRPEGETESEFKFSLLASFGSVLFGYGFHTVLPDIQASLHEKSTTNAHKDTKKAMSAVMLYSFPAYIVVALLGYAAFGSEVDPNLLVSITEALPNSAMFVVWAFVIVKTSTEATVFNQAAFTLIRDTFGCTDSNDHVDHHPKNWTVDVVIRMIYVVAAILVAIFIPFFSDLTSITAAISITPLSFVLPIVFWNKKHGKDASRLRIIFHFCFIIAWVTLALAALVGAIEDICDKISA